MVYERKKGRGPYRAGRDRGQKDKLPSSQHPKKRIRVKA